MNNTNFAWDNWIDHQQSVYRVFFRNRKKFSFSSICKKMVGDYGLFEKKPTYIFLN